MTRSIIFMLFILISYPIVILSQTGQTGSIKGTVYGINGSPKSGVIVKLRSPAIVLNEMIIITDEKGTYTFYNLAPGKYNLLIEFNGLTPIEHKGINISANRNITLDIQMVFSNSKETIIIQKGTPTVDRQSLSNVSTIDVELLKSLPKWPTLLGYLLLIPGLTGESGSYTPRSNISSLGSPGSDNIYYLDGLNVSDPSLGLSFFNYSMDTIEELSVNTSGIGTEHFSGGGAVINIITKSGGNKHTGHLALYYSNKSLQSNYKGGTPLVDRNNGDYEILEYNISQTGPIIKNKLWIAHNINFFLSKSFLLGFPYDKEQESPIINKRFLPFLKFTFQPCQKDKLTLTYNFYNENVNYSDASPFKNEDATRKTFTKAMIMTFNWNHYFRDLFYSNFKIGFFRNKFAFVTKNENQWGYDVLTNREFGNGTFDDKYLRQRIQFQLDSSLFIDNFLGNHELKFGGQLSLDRNQKETIPKYEVTDSIGIPRFKTYWKGNTLYRGSFYIGFNKKESLNSIGLYINDIWNINHKFILDLSLKFDLQTLIFPSQSSHQYLSQGDFSHIGFPDLTWNFNIKRSIHLFTWSTLTPKFGIIYDFKGNGKILFKANYSRYCQRAFTAYFFNAAPIDWVGYDASLNPDGSINYITNTHIPGTDKIGYKNHRLKAPYTDEFSVGLEKELWEDCSIQIHYIRRWNHNLIETVDANSLDIDHLLSTGEIQWLNWEPITTIDPFDGKEVTFWNQKKHLPKQIYIINPPGAKRSYHGLEVQLKKPFSRGWMFYLSYTYGKSEGLIENTPRDLSQGTSLYENPNAHINAYGRMPMEIRHQFRLLGLFKGPLGINFSGFLRCFSGFSYTRHIRSTDLGLDLFQGIETILAEPLGSRSLPFKILLDLRIEKILKIKNSFLHLYADIFNIFNNNKATLVEELSSNPNFEFKEIRDIMSPRVLRLGIKFQFN